MKLNELIDKIKDFSRKPAFPKVLIASGLILMLIILFSDLGKKDDTKTASDVNSDFLTAETYNEQLEIKLEKILTEIDGVGKAQVLVNISSTEEYVYAEEIKQGTAQSENSYVIIDKGSQKGALVKKINNPSVSGIIIVCEGGDDPKICEKVYKAVSTALNMPTNRIYVTEMK